MNDVTFIVHASALKLGKAYLTKQTYFMRYHASA